MIGSVAVVVPAADEEQHIGGCLRAICAARAHLLAATAGAVRTRVVVVLDACRDGSAQVVGRFPDVTAVEVEARCVGVARAVGTERALQGTDDPGTVWLAGTDADSRVPTDWLTTMVEAADAGADVVLGTVRPGAGLPERVAAAWFAGHDLTDGHPHVHGANLGIRASTYRALGGWRPLAAGEDEDLVARAVAIGARIHRTGRAPVETSPRSPARAPRGFGTYLADLHDGTGD